MENSKEHKADEGFTMKGGRREHSKQLKNRYSQLTDDDLKFEAGKENDLLPRVEKRLNKNREQVTDIIKKIQPVQV